MFSLLKFALTFTLSFFILSIPIQNKPLFHHLNRWAAPWTQKVFTQTKDVVTQGYREGKKLTLKAFTNTKPEEDAVTTKAASLPKDELPEEDFHQDYTMEEKEMLNKILKHDL